MVFRIALLAPLALTVTAISAAGAPPETPTTVLIQPPTGERGLVLANRPGRAGRTSRAWVESADGERSAIHLRLGENLNAIAETRSGFVVGGAKETSEGTLELVMMEERAGRVSRMETPGEQKALLRLRPTLMTTERDLDGVAWLEGDGIRSLSVRAADWSGVDWSLASTVSPPGRGSQSGLTGEVLRDGSWLLVWAAYDGVDDEITWSYRQGDRWSEPRRLTSNRVPDVTPTLVRDGNEVILAWAQMHGSGYRVVSSRFTPGSGWSSPRAVGGPQGYFPRFVNLNDRTYLTWRSGWPRAWAVAEVQTTGRLARHALVHEESEARPALVLADRDEVELRWSGPDRRKAARWEIQP